MLFGDEKPRPDLYRDGAVYDGSNRFRGGIDDDGDPLIAGDGGDLTAVRRAAASVYDDGEALAETVMAFLAALRSQPILTDDMLDTGA